MNNLQAYGSSDSDDEKPNEKEISSNSKGKLIFRVEKIVDDEDYVSKVKPKAKNLKDSLPVAVNSQKEESYESLLVGRKDLTKSGKSTQKVTEQPVDTQEEKDTVEAVDFFTIPTTDNEEKELEEGPILPLKPKQVVKPFVFKPKPKTAHTDDIANIIGREGRNQTIEFKTITIQDQMGNKSIQNDRDLTIDTPDEDDPFKNLKGTFVPTSSSSRVNGIMKLAYDAKNSYKVSKARKEERKAVQKVVRAKYGF